MPKYIIRAPRYLDGVYVFASPDFPAEVELPEGTKRDEGLFDVGSVHATEKLKPHYPVREREDPAKPKSASVPLPEVKPEVKQEGKKRPSDRDV